MRARPALWVQNLGTEFGYRNLYPLSMKTTLNINDQLLAGAKALAAQQRTSLTRLIEEGLQLRLRAKAGSAKQRRIRLASVWWLACTR